MQVACTLAGHLAWISPPLPGSVHDAKAIKEAYSQTAWRPVKPLVRTHLRKAVNKPQGIRIPHNPQCSKSYWRQRGSSQKVVGDGAGVRTGLVAWGGPSGWQDEGVYATSENPRALVRNATPPCLDTFCRLDRLGLSVTAQRVEPDHTVLRCRPTTPPLPCPGCARPGVRHDAVLRRLVHVLFGWKPTILDVVVPRYRCWPCRRIWRHSITAAALSKGKLSREAIMVAVTSIVVDADVDRPDLRRPRRGMEHRLGCDPGRRRRAGRQRRPA